VLRRKLGFYVSATGANLHNSEAEDLYQEAISKIVQILHDLKDASSSTDIANFEQYVARLSANVCIDYLRTKSPARTRLKDSLRDLFRRHTELVSWEFEGEILCGFAIWKNSGRTFFSHQQSLDTDARMESFKAARFPDEDVKKAPIVQLVSELFDWIGGPVEIDGLVRMIAFLHDVRDQPAQSLDDESKISLEPHFLVNASATDSELKKTELLTRLWQAVKKLPREQRDAFCFRFEDDNGQDLFTLLLTRRIVTLRDLAHEFQRPADEIILLSTFMPMDTPAITAELKASRDNVYKWRYRAIRRLREELSQD
jgi:RNA polymerase sigma factor (sigma-70 family)